MGQLEAKSTTNQLGFRVVIGVGLDIDRAGEARTDAEWSSRANRRCRSPHANDGTTALEIFERQAVDLAVVDMRLPGGLNGLETVRRARARHPDLKALFISGVDPIPSRRDPDREDFVSKPFSGHELLGCVFELLLRNKNGRQRVLNALAAG